MSTPLLRCSSKLARTMPAPTVGHAHAMSSSIVAPGIAAEAGGTLATAAVFHGRGGARPAWCARGKHGGHHEAHRCRPPVAHLLHLFVFLQAMPDFRGTK